MAWTMSGWQQDHEMGRGVNRDDVRELRGEAIEHRYHEQVKICDRALAGDRSAWRACEDVILESRARAQDDDR